MSAPQHARRARRPLAPLLWLAALSACDAQRPSPPQDEAATSEQAPSAAPAHVVLEGAGEYTVRDPSGQPLAVFELSSAAADARGELLTVAAPALPERLEAVSPAIALETEGAGLPVAGTLRLSAPAGGHLDGDSVWAVVIGDGGARRMPIAGWSTRGEQWFAELPAIDAGTYVLVAARAASGCRAETVGPSAAGPLGASDLHGAVHVRGDLTLTSDALADPRLAEALACLVRVDGALRIHDAPRVDALDALPGLTLVGGQLSLSSGSARATLPALWIAGGDVALTQVAEVALPALRSIGGGLGIGEGVKRVELPALTVVAGGLALVRTSLSDLDGLRGMRAVGKSLALVDNHALEDARGLDGVGVVGGALVIAQNPALRAAPFAGLSTLGRYAHSDVRTYGALRLEDSPALATADALHLEALASETVVR